MRGAIKRHASLVFERESLDRATSILHGHARAYHYLVVHDE